MAFCPSGTCELNKTSPKGYPQCTICGRVDLFGKKGTSSKTTKKKAKKGKKRASTPVITGFRPLGSHRIALKDQ